MGQKRETGPTSSIYTTPRLIQNQIGHTLCLLYTYRDLMGVYLFNPFPYSTKSW